MNFFEINTPATLLVGTYLALINIAAFFFFAIDKMKAGFKHRRIRERTLLLLAFLGGSIGALLAMNLFRHKTRKSSFQAIITLIILFQLLLLFLAARLAQ